MIKMGLVCKDDLYRVVNEAFEYLDSRKNTSSGKSGWHQFLETGKIGHIATAQVLILYKTFGRDGLTPKNCTSIN